MDEIVGHDRAVGLLARSLRGGRIHHAYLITGPARVGKATLARAFVRSLNCSKADGPCRLAPELRSQVQNPESRNGNAVCRSCRLILRGVHPDVRTIELAEDRSRISYTEIEHLQADAALRPIEARHKGYLILEAERLSTTAANQLLKTLEEPPAGVVLVLTAQDAKAMLPTIVSRCQELRLSPPTRAEVAAYVERRCGLEPHVAEYLARLANGRIGWALEAATDPEILQRREQSLQQLRRALYGGRLERLQVARALADQWGGRSSVVRETLLLWSEWLRDACRVRLGLEDRVVHADQLEQLREAAQRIGGQELRATGAALLQAAEDLELNANPRLALDVAMLRLGVRVQVSTFKE